MRLDGVEHHDEGLRGGVDGDLPGGGLDKVRACRDSDLGRLVDVLVRLELAGLEDDLEVGLAAGLLDRDDLVVDLLVVPLEELPAGDHHVDLVGTAAGGVLDLGDLDLDGRLPGGEGAGNAGDVHGSPLERLLGLGHKDGVDAHGGGGLHAARLVLVGEGLGAEVGDLLGVVGALEGGQVDDVEEELEGVGGVGEVLEVRLGVFLDARLDLLVGVLVFLKSEIKARHCD